MESPRIVCFDAGFNKLASLARASSLVKKARGVPGDVPLSDGILEDSQYGARSRSLLSLSLVSIDRPKLYKDLNGSEATNR